MCIRDSPGQAEPGGDPAPAGPHLRRPGGPDSPGSRPGPGAAGRPRRERDAPGRGTERGPRRPFSLAHRPTFLERKVGKRASCKAALCLWGCRPAGRGRRCDFLNDQKVTKESPGDGSDERLRAAGAHSHLSPGPPIYGSGSLQSASCFRRAKSRPVPSYSQATGPFFY